MMKLSKPKFWDKKGFSIFPLLLIPLTILYYLLFSINKYIRKISTKKFHDIKIVCIGNIYLGGTGKTPLTIEIFKELSTKYKVSVLKKFNKKHLDEINLLKKTTNLICTNKRVQGVEKSLDNKDNFLILDDGYQDYSFKKDFSIVCINSDLEFGNKMLLPSGPLRESIAEIKNFKAAVINGEKNLNLEKFLLMYNENLKIFYSNYKLSNLEKLSNKDILAFSGIANNYKFFDLLKSKLNVKKTISFPDHYNYSEDELTRIVETSEKQNMTVVTTAKDFCRIDRFKDQITCIDTELYIENKHDLINCIIND